MVGYIWDFLINNYRDRHRGNQFFSGSDTSWDKEDPDRSELIVIDNGFAFGGEIFVPKEKDFKRWCSWNINDKFRIRKLF